MVSHTGRQSNQFDAFCFDSNFDTILQDYISETNEMAHICGTDFI